MSKIRILAIPSDKHGVGKYRILDPYIYIGDNFKDDFHVDIVFEVPNDDSHFENYDVVVFHSFIHKTNHIDNLKRIEWLKNKGIKVIMDIDDYWYVDNRHPMYNQIKQSKSGENRVSLLKIADAITTTTPLFADTIKRSINSKNIAILPNAVNPNEPQFKSQKIESDRIRFGWLGGSSHYHDLELLSSGISGILTNYEQKTQFVLCGFDIRGKITEIDRKTNESRTRDIRPEETVWYQYEKIFTNNYKHLDENYRKFLLSFEQKDFDDKNTSYVRRWTQDISKYAYNYNYFDVSLAPLVESTFNANKSQLKVIEAGFHKKAIIASDVNPYKLDLKSAIHEGQFKSDGNSLLVSTKRNHKDWEKYMKKLIENPNMIEDMGNRLYETVKDTYSLENVSKNRVEFIKSIINN